MLVPLRAMEPHLMDDSDLAGPVFFCLLLGACLLLSGKIHFGYIYGISTLGWISLYFLINLMAEEDKGIDGARTASVLGYSILPMIFLSLVSLFFDYKGQGSSNAYSGRIVFICGIIAIGWCTAAASSIFSNVLGMQRQRFLIAYPICLLYTCFALLAIF